MLLVSIVSNMEFRFKILDLVLFLSNLVMYILKWFLLIGLIMVHCFLFMLIFLLYFINFFIFCFIFGL